MGKIENRPRMASVKRGEEKGNFAFGGSTIVLITEKNAVKPDEDILKNSQAGMETRVLMGEKIGERVLFFIFALHKIFLKNEITFTHTTQTCDIL